MLLAIDIGNTNLTIGIYEGEKLTFLSRLNTDIRRTAEQYAIELEQCARLEKKDITEVSGAIISSVVPGLTGEIKRAVFILTGVIPTVLGPGVKSGLNIKIDNPAQLGADLVAGAVAAAAHYPLPCLVMDLGTATKISVLDSRGDYRGCTISPGVNVSLAALSSSASLLPGINLEAGKIPAFGTNTISSMQAGVILGTAAMLDGLCDRIEAELGEKVASIVSTGGLSGEITKHCKRENIYEPNLILEGLRIIYNKNR